MQTPTLHPGTTIWAGKWLTLFNLEVTHPNGKTSAYEVVRRNSEKVTNIVTVLPITVDGDIVLIRQFRFPLGYEHLEAPAGCQEPNKHTSLEMTVESELREETGYVAETIIPIGKMSSSSGMTDEVVHAFIAINCHRVTEILDLDESEYIESIVVSRKNFPQLMLEELASGRAVDPKMLAMMWYVDNYLQKT